MTFYDLMFESINSEYENGNITFEQANELNDLAYGRYVTEKKSRAEYRLQKFKKEHEYDPKDGTIKLGNHRIPFNYTGGSKKNSTLIKSGALQAVNRNTGIVSDELSRIDMNRASFNQKHPKTHEFIARHEQGHIGAKNVKAKNPEAYDKESKKYQGFINNQSNKGMIFNTHSGVPEEYIADDVARKLTSNEIAKNDMKDSLKNMQKYYKANDKKYPNRRTDNQKNWENSPNIKEFFASMKETIDMCNNVLGDKNETPERKAYFRKYKNEAQQLVKDMRKDTEPETVRKSNFDAFKARLKAINGNVRLEYKKNLPGRKFIQDRGRVKMVKEK